MVRRGVLWGLVLAGAALRANSQAVPGNGIQNGGFEVRLPSGGWLIDPENVGRGIGGNSVYGVHSGRASLRLVPNDKNGTFFKGGNYGFAQQLPVEKFRGKALYYGGWMKVDGPVTGIIRVIARLDTGQAYYREIRLSTPGKNPVRLRDVIDIPDKDNVTALFLSCVAEGANGSAFFDDVWATAESPQDWPAALGGPEPDIPLTATVSIQADQVVRTIPRHIYGQNVEYQYSGNAIWNDQTDALDSDLVRIGRDMGTTILRFPAGFPADFYHWTDGTGPPGLRPITLSMPGANYTNHRFGTEEFLSYADAIGSDALFTVNVLTGTPKEAADWIRYVNNGKRRVEYWEVGNELYVDLRQLDPDAAALPPEEYGKRFAAFASEMRAADPSIKIGAILDHKYSTSTFRPFPDWTQVVLQAGGSQIDFVAVHNGFSPAVGEDYGYPVRTVYNTMLATSVLVKSSLAELSRQIDAVLGPAGSKVEVAVTEWAPLFDTNVKSRFLDHPKSLAAAIYCATMLKVFIEDPRTTLAAAFKMVDALELSWIGVRDGQFTVKAPFYALQLFTRHFGPTLVASKTDSPGYESRSLGWVDAVPYVPYLETVSSKSEDGRTLYMIAINRSLDRTVSAKINWQGFCAVPEAKIWILNGTAPDANTGTQLWKGQDVTWVPQAQIEPGGRFNMGGPGEIWLDTQTAAASPRSMDYVFSPHSVTAVELTASASPCN